MKSIHFFLCAALFCLQLPLSATASPLIGCDLSLDRSVLPADQPSRAILKLSLEVPHRLEAGERPPVNLALALDRSGSMSGEKLARAKEAAIFALRRLGEQDIFSLVAYDHSVVTLVPPQSAANQVWIENRIRSIGARGNTALYGAVNQAAAELRKNLSGPYIHRVILLSDGLANVGPSRPVDLGRLGAALIKEGISVTTIGIGSSYNEDLMARLAETSDGNHYYAASSSDLARIFASELGDVLNVAARDIVIEIDCPRGVRPLRIIGREGRISQRRITLHLNQLYAGQEKYALVEVEVDPGASGEEREIARASCGYENAVSGATEQSRARAAVRYSRSRREVHASANKPVVKALIQNEMAVSRDRALDLYNAGRRAEAVQELKQSSGKLKAQSEGLGFQDLADEAAGLEQEAATFAAPALPSAVKKEIRSQSYKVRQQQKDY